ncbi:hypothetical protein GXP67_03795 [Rhodocytophaga rosea]|uniref:Uncharacterized protein n=1 Tax=Rhodocytophaga rosea TaxID=2704465 RepID=A0A6C0GDU3_9BACT|nr:hypothetical protein [Rhodocytophaga rosea]QHT65850.1 hypothetical protein GXP67_03795 [Rhodocytophaga rosea]
MRKEYEQEGQENTQQEKRCLVIMPVADSTPYESGHFKRVYEYIIKPACAKAGLMAYKLEDVQRTNHIVINKLREVTSAEIAICDLSSKNSEVLYKLGIRQGLDLPTLLIKDTLTAKIFDIRGLLDVEYDETLRVDRVNKTIEEIAETLLSMYESKGIRTNSIISLLGIQKAEIKNKVDLSSEANILLEAISGVKDQILKGNHPPQTSDAEPAAEPKQKELNWVDSEGNKFQVGDVVTHPKFGLGILVDIIPDGLLRVKFNTIGLKVLRGEVEKLVLL